MITNNSKILTKNNKIPVKNTSLVSVPTFIILGDSNADGRLVLEKISSSRYNSQWAHNIMIGDKPTVKIFGSETTGKFRMLNLESANVYNPAYNCGFEQTIAYGLTRHYGNQQIRIIKYGRSSTTAGGTGVLSWQPGETQMNAFETVYSNAIAEAAKDGESLNLIACITYLGANDGQYLDLTTDYEVNMTTVIDHLRTNVFGSNVPIILTDCPENVLYQVEIRATQVNLCATLDDCIYFDLHRFGKTIVHPQFAGVWAGGMEIARTIITGLLSGTDYLEDYIFTFQTNRNGAFSLGLSINEGIYGNFYIDWGDGSAETEINTRLGTYNHTYTDGTTKTLKVKLICPWNIFSLTLDSSNSNLVGTLDLTNMTGLDSFTTSSGNTLLTAITPPRVNYSYLIPMAPSILYSCGISGEIDLKMYSVTSGFGLTIRTSNSITSIVDTSIGKYYNGGLTILNNANLATVNLGNVEDINGNFNIYNNTKLTSFTAPKSTFANHSSFLGTGNTILTLIQNYQYIIYVTGLDVYNCDLTKQNVDDIITEMWDRANDRSSYRNLANKTADFRLNNGVTGTFDGVTDWAGGLPTSPAAKAYDLLNDVTGVYNFTTFNI